MAKTTTKSKAAKAKGKTPAKKPTKKVLAKAKTPAPDKAKKSKKGTELSDEFLKTHAHSGNRESVEREVDKVLKRETENAEPVELLTRIAKQMQKKHGKGKDGKYKFRFTTANNVKGLIFRFRHVEMPGREVRLITYDNELYTGRIGFGRPVFNGTLTKTGGAALSNHKLDDVIPQKNKVGKYWWAKATAKTEKAIQKFMGEIGF